MKHASLLVLLLVSGFGHAAAPLTGEQIKTLIAGNSAAGFADALGKHYTAYYSPEGKLVQVLENKKRREGLWSVQNDQFCTQLEQEKPRCTKLVPGDNGEYWRMNDEGMVTNTFKKVFKGNAYRY